MRSALHLVSTRSRPALSARSGAAVRSAAALLERRPAVTVTQWRPAPSAGAPRRRPAEAMPRTREDARTKARESACGARVLLTEMSGARWAGGAEGGPVSAT
eukprot:1509712-Prymnesium_polylepis.1